MRIYFDNAATTPVSDDVFETMLPFLKNNYGNPSSSHQEGRTTRAALERARKQVAQGINATTAEILFTSGGTEANNTAIKCAVRDLKVKRIISSQVEHSCVYNSVGRFARESDVTIEYVNLLPTGKADLEHLEELLANSDKKTLVSLMHANNEVGTLNPIHEIGDLCVKYNAYFHTDTVQTIGHIPLDVKTLNAHFLSGSGHKLHGPKGIGFLYVKKTNQIDAYIDGGGQERQMRSGTENIAGIVGLGEAVDVAVNRIDTHCEKIGSLRKYFIEQIKLNFPTAHFNGDYEGDYLFTVLNVGFETNLPVGMLLFKLDLMGIAASGGSACNSGAVTGSRVLTILGVPAHYKSVRFSFSEMNTIEEVDYTIEQLKRILN